MKLAASTADARSVTNPPCAETPGLTAADARAGLARFGPNTVREEPPHPLRQFLRRFWAPIPWLLEAAIIVQMFLGERVEAEVIAGLLVANGVLGFLQEGKAQKALLLLRKQLRVEARIRRDGQWQTIGAEELVPDDLIHLRQGGIVPADIRLLNGSLLVDQSALTGESAAVSVESGKTAYAGALVRGGEANGVVTATGARTFFGKTAELVRTAHAANRQEHEIVRVVRDLFVLNACLIVIVFGAAHLRGLTLEYTLPLALTILLASIPVALPATFTLAAALGSLELSKFGVLVSRLSALHDIASMTVLCTDKTGTLTRNEATVSTLRPAEHFGEEQLLRAAWLASDPAGQDPVDGAMVRAATARNLAGNGATRIKFKPFDPSTKRAEAAYHEAEGVLVYTKGAPVIIAQLCGVPESEWLSQAQNLAARGQRVLGVAAGVEGALRFAGLIGLEDAVREDSRAVVKAIQDTGVRIVMITGDNAITACSVAEQVGIPPQFCPPEALHGDFGGEILENSVFAGVYPEDKFKLVRAFQRQGAVVGMSGDGVNDAPALRQAEAGIAVANATDVAKAAAAIVLTEPGLANMAPAIETSRCVFQRMMAYTLNMLSKKVELMLLLVAGFLLTGHKLLTPMLMVLIIFLNDFLTMALTTDHMSVSRQPNLWRTRPIAVAGILFGLLRLVFTFGVFALGHYALHFDMPHLQTLTFATVILGSQAGVYLLRERGHCWASRPSHAMIASTVLGLGVTAFIALSGWHFPAIAPQLLAVVAGAALIYFFALDWIKVWLFARLSLR
ncbi:MAG TPA: plasma-membrane proton-efflux P-type ATPase [Verrucomicrobiae bacterium]|nr:plasma-membrane proton-efflux P-type ATPase [Verrucomicrobiae bacterium]